MNVRLINFIHISTNAENYMKISPISCEIIGLTHAWLVGQIRDLYPKATIS